MQTSHEVTVFQVKFQELGMIYGWFLFVFLLLSCSDIISSWLTSRDLHIGRQVFSKLKHTLCNNKVVTEHTINSCIWKDQTLSAQSSHRYAAILTSLQAWPTPCPPRWKMLQGSCLNFAHRGSCPSTFLCRCWCHILAVSFLSIILPDHVYIGLETILS